MEERVSRISFAERRRFNRRIISDKKPVSKETLRQIFDKWNHESNPVEVLIDRLWEAVG